MQNRYAADAGDFGKFGMLRYIEKSGLKVGVNWYLVADESHNNDGKHIGYLEDDKYSGCDDELRELLKTIIQSDKRSVEQLEKLCLLNSNRYFHEELPILNKKDMEARDKWHKRGLNTMKDCDLVFLDPDNGLLPKSVSKNSCKSVKYVLKEEIIDYYKAGYSVVFYSHRTREQIETYLKRFVSLFEAREMTGATIKGVTFPRGTTRDYFFIMHEEHVHKIEWCLEQFFLGKWGEHFKVIL